MTEQSTKTLVFEVKDVETILAALTAERRATVERIRAAIHADTPRVSDIGTSIRAWLDALLDVEALDS